LQFSTATRTKHSILTLYREFEFAFINLLKN